MVPAQIKYEHIMLTPHSPLAPLVIKVSYSASVYFYVSGYSGIKNAVSYSQKQRSQENLIAGKFTLSVSGEKPFASETLNCKYRFI